ncbi:MAG: DHH family phosphoesterase [Candidatus Bathyarchaeia archaeon]
MLEERVFCISHGEDADGLICAAFLANLKGAKPILVTYDDFKEALGEVKPPTAELYICDLCAREELVKEILRIGEFARVVIVDHHPTAGFLLQELERGGVQVVYSPEDCASALLYDHYNREMGREEARLAAYAAISDQFEEGPIASRLLSMFDRHLIQHEALILTHALFKVTSNDFRRRMVEELRRYTIPHRIPGLVEAAVSYLEHTATLMEELKSKAVRLRRLAYFDASGEPSTGAVANLILDALDVDVGVSYKPSIGGRVNISIRGRRGIGLHLGIITREVAMKHGGFGGGHDRASGASIPRESLLRFIEDLEEALSQPLKPF